MIEKIIKVISNLKILSKMNEIIDGLNTHTTNTNNPHNVTAEQLGLATAYVYKGSVTNFSDLPTNAQNGWVYSVENEHTDSAGILHPAGANFAWNGSKWDDLGGSLSGYAKSVNSQSPDNKGNVNLTLVESLEKNTEDKLIVHNADGTTQEIELGKNNDNDLNNILDSITELENRVIPIEKGGTGATTVAAARNALGLGNTTGALPVANGGTDATTAADARTNLGLSTAVTGASISGKKITLTKADGTTQTLTTQDNGYHTGNATSIGGASATKPAVVVTSYQSGNSWYRKYSDGWIEQGGVVVADTNEVTLITPMRNTNYCVLVSFEETTSSTTVSYGYQSANSKTTTGFKFGKSAGVKRYWRAEG